MTSQEKKETALFLFCLLLFMFSNHHHVCQAESGLWFLLLKIKEEGNLNQMWSVFPVLLSTFHCLR